VGSGLSSILMTLTDQLFIAMTSVAMLVRVESVAGVPRLENY
jgi:hypothetical protein